MPKHKLFRYFSDPQYAESFLDGKLMFRSLSYFRDQEDAGVRGDKNEGTSIYHPTGGLEITNHTQGNSLTLVDHIFESSAHINDIFIYCLSKTLNEHLYASFQAKICVEIRDIKSFCKRISQSLPSNSRHPGMPGKERIGHHVEYYASTQSGARWALPDKIAISKLDTYAWQQEFRLAFSLTDAFDVENVETRIVHKSVQRETDPASHRIYHLSCPSIRDICTVHSTPAFSPSPKSIPRNAPA